MQAEYLDFKEADCKDCYKCFRECPVKAIELVGHQAKIIESRCILCGTCTVVCPQNAKMVHSEYQSIKKLLQSSQKLIATVAPSCIASFGVPNFAPLRAALLRLGFVEAEETAEGARLVVQNYVELLKKGSYKRLISSACPSLCQMIQMYYPHALPDLAPVDSPMIAHAKWIKKNEPEAKVIFIGPCIAKKKEAADSPFVDGVLTFEDLMLMFQEQGIDWHKLPPEEETQSDYANLAKAFPISHGIIHSFQELPEGYDYIAVDGTDRCIEVLEHLDKLSGVFIEMNTCKGSCVNGPCALPTAGSSIKAASDVRKYARKENEKPFLSTENLPLDLFHLYRSQNVPGKNPSEEEIKKILAQIGKYKEEDELNCGACGYHTCREKAWAVYNGFVNVEICLPYMKHRAETLSYEIIKNSPEGLIVIDFDMRIVNINKKAKDLLGILDDELKGKPAVQYFNPSNFVIAREENKNLEKKKIYIEKTKSYINVSINILPEQRVLFGIMQDITQEADYDEKLKAVRLETLETTDKVVKKQMKVAQEIASLLGETTAETKVALMQLKKILSDANN